MNRLLSIITISYNSENVIRETIESVLLQTYRPLEYIIIDGGSEDSTMSIISEYSNKFIRADINLKYISEPDRGISDAFNKGIERAAGDVIGLLNAGDSYIRDVLSKVMGIIDEKTDVLCGDILWMDTANSLQYTRCSCDKWDELRYKMSIMHPSCFVKKSTYNKYGLFDISFKYAMDYELLSRFYRKGATFRYIALTIACMKSDGVSDSNSKEMFEEIQRIIVNNGINPLLAYCIILKQRLRNSIVQYIKGNLVTRKAFARKKHLNE